MSIDSVCCSVVDQKIQPFYLCMNVYVAFCTSLESLSSLFLPQVLRTHVMVRVGGGWDTLEHYLDKHDPCHCAAFGKVPSCCLSACYKETSLLSICVAYFIMYFRSDVLAAADSERVSNVDNSVCHTVLIDTKIYKSSNSKWCHFIHSDVC